MHISSLTLAAILSLFSSVSLGADHIVNYCNHIGGFAAGLAMSPNLDFNDADLKAEASIIATKTAFEYNLTKSKIFEVARDPKIASLTPAEFAGFHFFWCVYDLEQIQFGADAFTYQRKAIDLYHTTINRK